MGLGLGLGWDNGTQWDNGPIVEMKSHGTSWTLVGNTGQLSLRSATTLLRVAALSDCIYAITKSYSTYIKIMLANQLTK